MTITERAFHRKALKMQKYIHAPLEPIVEWKPHYLEPRLQFLQLPQDVTSLVNCLGFVSWSNEEETAHFLRSPTGCFGVEMSEHDLKTSSY